MLLRCACKVNIVPSAASCPALYPARKSLARSPSFLCSQATAEGAHHGEPGPETGIAEICDLKLQVAGRGDFTVEPQRTGAPYLLLDLTHAFSWACY